MIFLLIASAFAAPVATTTVHHTYWVVAGTSEYPNYFVERGMVQNLPGVDGATDDCMKMVAMLTDFGYESNQVFGFCGGKLLKSDLIASVKGLKTVVQSGDTVIVVWEGSGGFAPSDPSHKYFQPSEGEFTIDSDTGNDFLLTGIDPINFEGFVRNNTPDGTQITFLTDTARAGLYNGLDLHGPTATYFNGVNAQTRAYSPIAGTGKAGLLPSVVQGCLHWGLPTNDGGSVSVEEASNCFSRAADTSGVTFEAGGDWSGKETILWYPEHEPKQTIAQTMIVVPNSSSTISVDVVPPAPIVPKHKSSLKPVVRWSGLAVGLGAGGAGVYTYAQAAPILKTMKELDYTLPTSMREDYANYEALRIDTYALWGIAAVGGLAFGGSFLFHDTHVVPTPNGVIITGQF